MRVCVSLSSMANSIQGIRASNLEVNGINKEKYMYVSISFIRSRPVSSWKQHETYNRLHMFDVCLNSRICRCSSDALSSLYQLGTMTIMLLLNVVFKKIIEYRSCQLKISNVDNAHTWNNLCHEENFASPIYTKFSLNFMKTQC